MYKSKSMNRKPKGVKESKEMTREVMNATHTTHNHQQNRRRRGLIIIDRNQGLKSKMMFERR